MKLSGFQTRGLIEGFYGTPWRMQDRRLVLEKLAARGINAYFYGPKDDPLHRERWRALYPPDGGMLPEMIALAEDNGMSFCYLLAPGLDIRYTSEADLAAIERKYAQVYRFGVRRFGLLLDDLEQASCYPADAAAYPTQAEAHAALANRVFRMLTALDPQNTLVVCPTQYWGSPDTPYLRTLSRSLPAAVDFFYTGSRICSAELTAADAEAFQTATGRQPLFWDNYPVNDAEMVDELHLAPYAGRAPELAGKCRGIVLNPMEFAHLSLIPLLTAADFLNDPTGYQPEKSFDRAVCETVGAELLPAVRRLAEFCWKSCLTHSGFHYRYDAPTGRNASFEAAYEAGTDVLCAYVRESGRLFQRLDASAPAAFRKECQRWLDTAAAFCTAAENLLAAGDDTALRSYLYRPEDVMKPEAARMLALSARETPQKRKDNR